MPPSDGDRLSRKCARLEFREGQTARRLQSKLSDLLGRIGRSVSIMHVCGARPKQLSSAFIVEEGFPLADLERIVNSMRQAAVAAGAAIGTGDTKVVKRGE